jgi:hypothetical protein
LRIPQCLLLLRRPADFIPNEIPCQPNRLLTDVCIAALPVSVDAILLSLK